ncbi:putative tail fiber protein [Pseudomonas phage vB_PcuM_ KLEP17-4]|nr:putative tail fiber protein [Pseudomonas phage vB_PcuM_ KLEP17-4]
MGTVNPIVRPVFSAVAQAVVNGPVRRGQGGQEFPEKDSYFTDYAGIADGTLLRNLPGWAAYSSTSSTHPARDQWVVQDEKAARTSVEGDYTDWPGRFIIGRDTGSTDHVYRCKLVDFPETIITLAVAATDEANCIYLYYVKAGGNFTIDKKTAGSTGSIFGQAASSSALGRLLEAGDEIELRVLGRRIHLLVNGISITPPEGANIDNGGTFTKGTVCGHGTFVGEGSAFTDEYFAPLSAVLTADDTEAFWPGSVALGGRVVPVSGDYVGSVLALDYRVVNSATGAVVRDWGRIASPDIADGTWSAGVFVPMCSRSVNPKIRIQVRAANDVDAVASTNTTAVGFGVPSYGQSNSAYRGQGLATEHAVSDGYIWSLDAGSQWLGGGTVSERRSELWASTLAEIIDIPVGVFVFGKGSQTLALLAADAPEGFFDELMQAAELANIAGYAQSVLWTQGEAEASGAAVFNTSQYRAIFGDELAVKLRTQLCESPDAPIGICGIGPTTGGHISGEAFGNANWSAARATLFGLQDLPNVFYACNLMDGVSAEGVHFEPDTYVENGRRAGLSMAEALGYDTYNGRGPLITGATRSGAVITLPIDLNGAASVSGTGLTNYDVSADDFATTLTISSAAVSGGNIVLTLSADPGAPVKVRSFYDMDWASPVRAIGAYADGTSIPVEPLYVSIDSN